MLFPVIVSIAVMAAGYLTGIPAFWIVVGGVVTLAATMQACLVFFQIGDRLTAADPQHRLREYQDAQRLRMTKGYPVDWIDLPPIDRRN